MLEMLVTVEFQTVSFDAERWRASRARWDSGFCMGSQVSLPLWVVALMAILAILAALDRILIPSVRWAVRRRANRVIEELNTKLKLRIQPFKLT